MALLVSLHINDTPIGLLNIHNLGGDMNGVRSHGRGPVCPVYAPAPRRSAGVPTESNRGSRWLSSVGAYPNYNARLAP